MTVEHKTERQAVVLHHKLLIVCKAETEPVGILSYVRLHHSRSHYIFADMLLNRISHTADRTALARLEHFVYRYCKYTFSHFFRFLSENSAYAENTAEFKSRVGL